MTRATDMRVATDAAPRTAEDALHEGAAPPSVAKPAPRDMAVAPVTLQDPLPGGNHVAAANAWHRAMNMPAPPPIVQPPMPGRPALAAYHNAIAPASAAPLPPRDPRSDDPSFDPMGTRAAAAGALRAMTSGEGK